MQRVFRILFPLAALLASASAFVACPDEVLRETETYPDGSPAWEREYLRAAAALDRTRFLRTRLRVAAGP